MTSTESSRSGALVVALNAKLSTGKSAMSLKTKLGILAAALMLSGCMQAATYEATNTNNFKPRDNALTSWLRFSKRPRPFMSCR